MHRVVWLLFMVKHLGHAVINKWMQKSLQFLFRYIFLLLSLVLVKFLAKWGSFPVLNAWLEYWIGLRLCNASYFHNDCRKYGLFKRFFLLYLYLPFSMVENTQKFRYFRAATNASIAQFCNIFSLVLSLIECPKVFF